MDEVEQLKNRVKQLEEREKASQAGFDAMITLISLILYATGKSPEWVKKHIVSDNLKAVRGDLIDFFNSIEPSTQK